MGEIGGEAVIADGQRGLSGTGYRLLVPSAGWNTVEQKLTGARAEQLSDESYHILRVEAGLPAAGAELTEEFTPLEAGLDYAVSGAKGCYTGQEVLARQTTYDKVTQHLVCLRLDAPARVGERLWAEGKSVGVITSTATSPRLGAIALGMVRRPYHEAGAALVLGASGVKVVVC
jgi:folate-binding protein YgfZ